MATSMCGLDTATVTVQVFSAETNAVNLQACDGETVLYNGIPLSAGTTSTFTFANFQGCDSVVTVTVAELPTFASSLQLTACDGETVTYNGQSLAPGSTTPFVFTAANGCDSTVTVTVAELPTFASNLQLAACDGETVTYNGQSLAPGSTTPFVFAAANGCDSTVTVTVVELQNFASSLTLQTCTGSTITYDDTALSPGTTTDFTLTAANGCDSVVTVSVIELSSFAESIGFEACTGTTVTYAGTPLSPGTVTDFTFTAVAGCDSVVTVTVTEVSVILENVGLQACTGETVLFNGQNLLPGTVTDFDFTTAQGCDSIVTVTVAELQTSTATLELQACTGTTVTYGGTPLSPGTSTDFTLAAANGCDSVVTVDVEEIFATSENINLQACAGETMFFNGQQLAAGSTTVFDLTNWQGCDSTLTVTVEELETYTSVLDLQACTGTTIVYNGVPLPPGTTIPFTLTATNGCDSVVAVTVTEVETIFEEIDLATCPGSTIIYAGTPLGPNTVTDFTFQSYLGCDSVVTVTVEELDVITASLELEACANESVVFNGQNLLPGSTTDFDFITAAGCDSILTVTVTELETFTAIVDLQACTGSTVPYNGQPLAPGSTTDFTLAAANGCDSVVTVSVEEIFATSANIELQACTGETVFFNGQQLAAGTTTVFDLTNWQGCDSTLTVAVEELLPQAAALQLETCEGSTVTYAGQQLAAGSVTDVVLTTSNGCDSTVTVTVLALEVLTGAETLQGCEGEALFYQGTEITPGTSMDFTLTSSNGCDSVVTVTALASLPAAQTAENIEISDGASVLVFGQLVSLPGVYSQVFAAANGCDSTHTITVGLSANLLLDFPDGIEIGLGETATLQPLVDPTADLTFAWENDPTLSCWDCQNPVASPPLTTTYTLTISDPDGCSAQGQVQVLVRKKYGVYIPNSFSPNDDGINDVFLIFSDTKTVAQVKSLRVFSRWGEPVFEYFNFPTNDQAYGWDGSFRTEEMDPAVFIYFTEVEFVDGEVRLFKGDVTLVR